MCVTTCVGKDDDDDGSSSSSSKLVEVKLIYRKGIKEPSKEFIAVRFLLFLKLYHVMDAELSSNSGTARACALPISPAQK